MAYPYRDDRGMPPAPRERYDYDSRYPPPAARYGNERGYQQASAYNAPYDYRDRPDPNYRAGYDDRVPPPRQHDDYHPSYSREGYQPPAHYEPQRDAGRAPPEGQWRNGYHQQQQHIPLPHHEAQQAPFVPSDRPRPAPVRPEPPSASVVLLGLPAHVDDSLLRAFLEDLGASVDSTTVIYDRATGLSKRYGFAKFGSVEHARSFVEPNFPSILWRERGNRVPAPGDENLRIKLNYSQKTGGWREDQGAGARLTDDQRKAKDGGRDEKFYVNDGTRDVGSAPTQILLLRGLDPLVTEAEIVASLAAIPGKVGQQVQGGGVKKVFITKDRASRSSWGYAFVQFSDVRLATEVLASAFNPKAFPTGFRIRSAIIAFSFTHENSFVPIYARSEFSFRGEGGQQLAYWDDKAFVAPWLPGQIKPVAPPPAPKDDEAQKVEDDMEAFFSSIEAEVPQIAAAAPIPSAVADADIVMHDNVSSLSSEPTPLQFPLASTHETSAAASGKLPAPGQISIQLKSTAPSASGNDAEERLKTIMKARKSKDSTPATEAPQAEKKKDVLIVSRKAAKDISKWNVKQQELNPGTTASSGSGTTATSASSRSSTNASASTSTASATVPTTTPLSAATTPASSKDEFEYGDPVTFICLLCQRQFKSVPDLAKHNRLSALHKTNLANPTAVTAATQRKANSLAKASTTALASTPASGSEAATSVEQDAAPKYIDRAAARREAFNQPDHPVPEGSTSKKRKLDAVVVATAQAPTPPPEQRNKNGIEETNVGAKMLEKMGWSKGGGLGSAGTGIVDPIKASQFQQGAGLGSTKGVVVGESVATPATYKEALREKARQRLEDSVTKPE